MSTNCTLSKLGNVRKKLEDIIQKRQMAHISFVNPEMSNLNGFPLRLGSRLLLFQFIYDFHFDGYYIIDISSIKAIRSNKYERFFEKMLDAEGMIEHIADPECCDIQDWKSALRSLNSTGENIIVEWMDDGELVFFIGKVARFNKNYASFRQFDAVGKWIAPWPIPYDNIVDIQFRNKYINIFSKYVKPYKP